MIPPLKFNYPANTYTTNCVCWTNRFFADEKVKLLLEVIFLLLAFLTLIVAAAICINLNCYKPYV